MPRPILTDEMIEEAKHNKRRLEQNLKMEMENDEVLAKKYEKIEKDLSKQTVYKSRRIENAKQVKRSKSINKWLMIVVFIVIILLGIFIWYYFLSPPA